MRREMAAMGAFLLNGHAFRALVLATALQWAGSSAWAADGIVECSMKEQWDTAPEGLKQRATPEQVVFSFDTVSGRIVQFRGADAADIQPADFMSIEGRGDWSGTWVIVPAQTRKASIDATLAAVAYAPVFRLWPIPSKGEVVMGLSVSGPGSVGVGNCVRRAPAGGKSR